jgi:hypothetical protein
MTLDELQRNDVPGAVALLAESFDDGSSAPSSSKCSG